MSPADAPVAEPMLPVRTILPSPLPVAALRPVRRGARVAGRRIGAPSVWSGWNSAIPTPGPSFASAGLQSAGAPLQTIAPGPLAWKGSAWGKTTRGAATDAHLTNDTVGDQTG